MAAERTLPSFAALHYFRPAAPRKIATSDLWRAKLVSHQKRQSIMKMISGALLVALQLSPATAETYSTIDQFGMVRNHATHEDAENIVLTGKIISSSVERGNHSFAVAFNKHLFICVAPWDSNTHCRSQTSEALFAVRK